jgi:serine/threonine protein kinase
MVMNFCAGGDMERQVKLGRFPEPKTRKICCEVVLALEELHAQNYLFRDLKTSNVLLDEDGHIKIADFGLAKQSRLGESCVGTVNYLAPEMLVDTETKPHTAALDWYLFGVFTYELLTGRPPFFNDNPNVMFEAIKREKPKLPMGLSS